jgi:hypothetical protein
MQTDDGLLRHIDTGLSGEVAKPLIAELTIGCNCPTSLL